VKVHIRRIGGSSAWPDGEGQKRTAMKLPASFHKDVADLDEMYQGRAVNIIEQLTYDRIHVEIRMAAVAA